MHTTIKQTSIRTSIFTSLALIAFAANSVLCRMALGDKAIDAASFTNIRLLSGAITLFIILRISRGNTDISATTSRWGAAIMLFLYAITFSFAYITLDIATGALILFGAVQITIILLSIRRYA